MWVLYTSGCEIPVNYVEIDFIQVKKLKSKIDVLLKTDKHNCLPMRNIVRSSLFCLIYWILFMGLRRYIEKPDQHPG
jgi:hypothetical protein